VLAALAEWHYHAQRWTIAADLYARYIALIPDDWLARGHLAETLMRAGRFADAIPALHGLLGAPLVEESHASVSANLALALCATGDPGRGLEVAKAEPLQKHPLSPGLVHALHTRAICYALTGDKTRAIHDMDRVYAADPTYPDLDTDRAAIRDGAFHLEFRGVDDQPVTPAAASGADDGEQAPPLPPPPILSPDRRYWWDGSVWLNADASAPTNAARSSDGNWWWDGTEWRPVPITAAAK
jgi:tetratricopeptide (TPR) repeat protein